MSTATSTKLILVIGATGAQGMAVIDGLLASKDGEPSSYRVRALTRDISGSRAKELAVKGVECVQGSFEDFTAVARAFDGVYGAYVNTDTFTVGGAREMYAGVKIFEIAKRTPSSPFLGPFNVRADGTRVFASTLGDGHVPMITLTDIGFWARWIFDNRSKSSAEDLKVASDMINWDTLVETFTRVTGFPAVHLRLPVDEWWSYFIDSDAPMAYEGKRGDGSTTVRQNFTMWYTLYGDDMIEKDMDWIRSIHPGTQDTEAWMRATGYTGIPDTGRLKGQAGIVPNLEKMKLL